MTVGPNNSEEKEVCVETLRAMYLFIDRETDEARRDELGQHLADCPPCLEKFEFEAELKTVIAARCTDEVPDHLYERVRSSLRIEIQKMSGEAGIPES